MTKMVLLFWLKKDETFEGTKGSMKEAVSLLKDVSVVTDFAFGTSGDFGDHVIDNTFDYAAVLTMDSYEDLPVIMKSEEHMKMAVTLKQHVERMQAFVINCF